MSHKPGKGFTGMKHSLAAKLAISRAKEGELNPNWKGGITFSQTGHPMVPVLEHPHATLRGYVLESHLIAEEALGRHLKPGEIVHHTNEDPLDNRNSNLLICKQDYHAWLHARMRRRKRNATANREGL